MGHDIYGVVCVQQGWTGLNWRVAGFSEHGTGHDVYIARQGRTGQDWCVASFSEQGAGHEFTL